MRKITKKEYQKKLASYLKAKRQLANIQIRIQNLKDWFDQHDDGL